MAASTKRRTKWTAGAVHAVPLPDGSFGVAQIAGATMLNILHVAIFDIRLSAPPTLPGDLASARVISLAATWRQPLERGDWPFLGVTALRVPAADFPNERLRAKGFVGAMHYDHELLQDLVAAWYRLAPWNVFYDESFFDALLAPGVARPRDVVLLSPTERAVHLASSARKGPSVT